MVDEFCEFDDFIWIMRVCIWCFDFVFFLVTHLAFQFLSMQILIQLSWFLL